MDNGNKVVFTTLDAETPWSMDTYLAIDGYNNQQQKIRLEKQNVKSELSLLKSQINN